MDGSEKKDSGAKPSWRDSNGALITLGLILGPFAIPFIWLNRKLSVAAKVFWTVVLVALAMVLYRSTAEMAERLNQELKRSGLL